MADYASDQYAAVVSAAVAEFADHGIRRTSVEHIARRAGISRATAYRRFPGGRDEILDAVVASETSRYHDVLQEAIPATGTPESRLTAMLTAALYHLSTHKLLRRLFQNEPDVVLVALGDRWVSMARSSRGRYVELFGSVLDLDAIPRQRLEIVGEMLDRMLITFAVLPSDLFKIEDDESVRAVAREVLAPGLLSALHSLRAAYPKVPAARSA